VHAELYEGYGTDDDQTVPEDWTRSKHYPEETESSRIDHLKQDWADSNLNPTMAVTPEGVTAGSTCGVDEIREDWGSNIKQTKRGHLYDQLHDGNRDTTLVETQESSKDMFYLPLTTQIRHNNVPPLYQDIKSNKDSDTFRQSFGRHQSKEVVTEWNKRQYSTMSLRNQFDWGGDRGVSMPDHSRRDIGKSSGNTSLTEFQNNSNIWPEVRNYKKFYSSTVTGVERSEGKPISYQEVTAQKENPADSRSSLTDMLLQSNSRKEERDKHKCDQNKYSFVWSTDIAHDASKETSVTKSETGNNYSVFGNLRH
jgi:hypothetical protein